MSALVDPAWLHRRRNDPAVRLIEIAGMNQDGMQAYKAGHVPGAVCWKWKDMLWDPLRRDFPTPGDFARRCGEAGIGNDTTVVFYGEGLQFGVYAWWTFRYCGHRKVKVLDGGRYRWVAEGRPLTTEESPAAAPVTYPPVKRVERMRVLRDRMFKVVDSKAALLLDGRSPEEYRGERVGGPEGPDVGALRYGRIPGAKHLYFEELLDGNKAFKPAAEMQQLFAARGAAPERDVIA
jgi:thiosulfate/3-mercaptopyruvate sulfurtransferase